MDADFFHEACEVEAGADDADGADHGGAVCVDFVCSYSDVISAGSADVVNDGIDFFLGVLGA